MNLHLPLAFVLCLAPLVHAASTQIGDLRLPSGTYSGDITYFDPASPGDTTRAVFDAPVAVNSSFLVATQNPGGTPDSATDVGIRSWSNVTTIYNLNRFGSDPDGPGAATGPQRVGTAQWTIDLAPLTSYLGANNLDLTALDLRLATDLNDEVREYDVYLSYTNPAESITLAGIGTTGTTGDDNYDNFWWPAQSVAEGNVANGTHKVIELDYTGDMDITIDLLALHDAGIEDFNLIIAMGSFYQNDNIQILNHSGLSIDTVPIPEPGTSLFGLLAAPLLLRRRR